MKMVDTYWKNVPTGKIRMQIQYLGKVSIDTLINVNKDLVLNFTMRNEDFKLKEVTVTATNSRSGKSIFSHFPLCYGPYASDQFI